MLDRTKNVIPLSTWALEKRGRYWYAVKPQFFQEGAKQRGPYSSIVSAALMIAREHIKEAQKHFKPG